MDTYIHYYYIFTDVSTTEDLQLLKFVIKAYLDRAEEISLLRQVCLLFRYMKQI